MRKPFSLSSKTTPADPAASYWLRQAWKMLCKRDPVDALNDAECLYNLAQTRLAQARLEQIALEPFPTEQSLTEQSSIEQSWTKYLHPHKRQQS